MFAVVGVWEMQPAPAEIRAEGLARLVEGVRQSPGLVKGYWSDEIGTNRSHTFIVFADRPNAERFADAVRANVDNQASAGVRRISLDLMEIAAET